MLRFFLALLLLSGSQAFGQKEYMLDFDPQTGTSAYHCAIPDLNFLDRGIYACNSIAHTYTLPGTDVNNAKRLFTVDMVTKTVIYSPAFSDQVGAMAYDHSDQKLYALLLGSSTVAEIDPVTGTYTVVALLSGFSGITMDNSAYDDQNHIFFFVAKASNNDVIYKVNTASGAVSTVPFGVGGLVGLRYHAASGLLYGVSQVGSTISFASIDPATGVTSQLSPVLNHSFGTATIDPLHNRYVMSTCINSLVNNTICKFLTFSLPSGTQTATVTMPSFPNGIENFLNMAYDSVLNKYVALHWDTDSTDDHLAVDPLKQATPAIYPNPADDVVYIHNLSGKHSYVLSNVVGIVQARGVFREHQAIDVRKLIPGFYILQIEGYGSYRFYKK